MARSAGGFWPHQELAIERCSAYFAAFRAGKCGGSALVRMPTGAGKSGIIAALAAQEAVSGPCLVVTPWVALREQIVRDVEGRFWSHAGIESPGLSAFSFTPKTLGALWDRPQPAVFACTHATLQSLHADQDSEGGYSRLATDLSVVLVDEGHREPAPSWAAAVRGLKKPCVLFSATPYRNDRKLFSVDDAYVTRLTFHEAMADNLIRRVEFEDEQPVESPEGFIEQLLDFVDRRDSEGEGRVIVRCGGAAQVADIATRLVGAGHDAIGLHETFGQYGPKHLRRTVPDPETDTARFWVHQFKLLEGVDDPRFAYLALYEPLGNARALVQQVGRVVRNKAWPKPGTAFVLGDEKSRERWEGYLRYEGGVC